MTVKKPFKLDNRLIPNGSVLILHIRYENAGPGGDTRGRTNPTTYTYAALKTGGLYYLTGLGRVPQAAGWAAVERWLERDGRVLEFVEVAGPPVRIWPEPVSQDVQHIPDLTKVHPMDSFPAVIPRGGDTVPRGGDTVPRG